MSAKDTYKSWKTTLLGLLMQGAILAMWYKGIQPIELWSVVLFLSGFGLWFMPDATIGKVKAYLKRFENNK